MSERPEIPNGYLGSQPNFGEMGLQTASHPNPEFHVDTNEAEIKLKAPNPVKITTNLIQCSNEAELSQYVFTQTKDGVIDFVISFPESGFYKFQIFALPAKDESKSLPNVFNYLIDVRKARKAICPYPKQYAQWKDGCYLYHPLVLNATSSLVNVQFKVFVPNAKSLAIVAAGEWFHLTKKGDNFEGSAALDKHRGKNVKITLNANFGGDESKYATLLEYIV